MDSYNMQHLDRYAKAVKSKTKILLLGDYNPNSSDRIIMDPFFDNNASDFEKCFQQIQLSCSNFLISLIKENNLKVAKVNEAEK